MVVPTLKTDACAGTTMADTTIVLETSASSDDLRRVASSTSSGSEVEDGEDGISGEAADHSGVSGGDDVEGVPLDESQAYVAVATLAHSLPLFFFFFFFFFGFCDLLGMDYFAQYYHF